MEMKSEEQIVTATLSLPNLKFQIVRKILINEECVIVSKYNSYQPEGLLSPYIFLESDLCSPTRVQVL